MALFQATMTAEQRAEVRRRWRRGEGQVTIAASMGVSQSTVSRACRDPVQQAERRCANCPTTFVPRSRWKRLCADCNEMARCMAC